MDDKHTKIGKPEYNETDDGIHDRIRTMIPDGVDQCAFIATILGCSAEIMLYMSNEISIRKMPLKIRYCCALIAGNLAVFTCAREKCDLMQFPTIPNDSLGEQSDELLYRKMKIVLEHLNKAMKEINEV